MLMIESRRLAAAGSAVLAVTVDPAMMSKANAMLLYLNEL